MNLSDHSPFIVRFKIRFTSGNLDGLTVPCEVNYGTFKGADDHCNTAMKQADTGEEIAEHGNTFIVVPGTVTIEVPVAAGA